MEETVCSSFAL